jgi:hypothetical protein
VLTKHLQIERHLALDGSDNPGEILLTFLFRYGDVPGFSNVSKHARTSLSQLMVIASGDGSADMGNVFQVQNCITVFAACWHRLQSKLKRNVNPEHSLLRYIVDPDKLENRRMECSRKAAFINRVVPRGIPNPTLFTRQAPALASKPPPSPETRGLPDPNWSRQQPRSSKRPAMQEKQEAKPTRSNPPEVFEVMSTDEEAEQLKASYGESTKSSKGPPKKPKQRKRGRRNEKELSRRR